MIQFENYSLNQEEIIATRNYEVEIHLIDSTKRKHIAKSHLIVDNVKKVEIVNIH